MLVWQGGRHFKEEAESNVWKFCEETAIWTMVNGCLHAGC